MWVYRYFQSCQLTTTNFCRNGFIAAVSAIYTLVAKSWILTVLKVPFNFSPNAEVARVKTQSLALFLVKLCWGPRFTGFFPAVNVLFWLISVIYVVVMPSCRWCVKWSIIDASSSLMLVKGIFSRIYTTDPRRWRVGVSIYDCEMFGALTRRINIARSVVS